MNWQTRSLDLNPTEHLLEALEKDVKTGQVTPATHTESWTTQTYVLQAKSGGIYPQNSFIGAISEKGISLLFLRLEEAQVVTKLLSPLALQ